MFLRVLFDFPVRACVARRLNALGLPPDLPAAEDARLHDRLVALGEAGRGGAVCRTHQRGGETRSRLRARLLEGAVQWRERG